MYSWEHRWEDYYVALGIPRTATLAEIKAAFRKKAKDWHPDKTRDASDSIKAFAEQQFKLCNRAKETLTNPSEKADYDTEWDKKNPPKKTTSGASTGTGTSSTASGRKTGTASGTKTGAGRTRSSGVPPTPPPPPKVYKPVIGVDPATINIEAEEGRPVSFGFTVNHLSGDLPPVWELGIKIDEVWLDKASFSMSPTNSFPARITVTLPPQPAGDFYGSISIQVDESVR